MQFSVSQTVARRLAQPVSRIGRRASRALSRVEPYVFILPALIFYVVFLALPVAGTLFISFLDWSGMSLLDMNWVGLKNYIDLAQDGVFWLALGHNVFFILVGSTAIVVLGLVLAVLLERGLRGSSFFRGVFFMPTVMSMVVVGIVFMLLLSPTLGLVNPILETLGLGRFKHAWLGDPNTALLTVIACHVWKSFGLAMFLFIAGLKGIDSELYEAASIDGASTWQSFWRLTLPLLAQVGSLVIVLTSIETLKLFDLVYVMTHGGPNHASEVLTTWMYFQGFMYNRMGYGSSIGVVLLFLTFMLTLFQFKVLRRNQA